VITNFSLGDILRNKDVNGQIVKWVMELCPLSLEFHSRTTIKSQALVNFFIEWADLNAPPTYEIVEYWQMYFDGLLNIDGVEPGIFFVSPNKNKLCYILRLHFPTSNNVAEYEACLHGMRLAFKLGIKRLHMYGDLALVINQLNMDWDTTHEKMDAYYKEIRKIERKFYSIEYRHVVQEKNQAADTLSKLGSS